MNGKILKYRSQAEKLGIPGTDTGNMDRLLFNIVDELRGRKGSDQPLPVPVGRCKVPGGMRWETTLYEYYIGLIRDTLIQIRKANGSAYIFSVEQIADVLKYEKQANFEYLPESDCFRVTL